MYKLVGQNASMSWARTVGASRDSGPKRLGQNVLARSSKYLILQVKRRIKQLSRTLEQSLKNKNNQKHNKCIHINSVADKIQITFKIHIKTVCYYKQVGKQAILFPTYLQ